MSVDQLESVKYSDLVEHVCDSCQLVYHKTKYNVYSNSRRPGKPRPHGVLNLGDKTYCSKKCQTLGQVTRSKVPCQYCGVETLNSNYCSNSCSAKVSNKQRIRFKKTHLCIHCNQETIYNRKFCDQCMKDGWQYSRQGTKPLQLRTIEESIQRVTHSGGANRYTAVRSNARTLYKEQLAGSCEVCGYSKHVELCHIKPISSFPLDTLLTDVNAPSNVTFLCPNCHWEYDRGRLTSADVMHNVLKRGSSGSRHQNDEL